MSLTGQIILSNIEGEMETIKQYGVKKIGLFGSYAQNNQTVDSDIDLLVEFKQKEKTFDNYMELKFFLEDMFARKVDLDIVWDIVQNKVPELKAEVLTMMSRMEGQ